MKLTGKLVAKPFAVDSKSERQAIYLETDLGSFELRIIHENPFEQSRLQLMVGQTVCVEGKLERYLFLAESKDIETLGY